MHVSVDVVADRWVVIIHTISFHPFVSVVTGPAFSYETKWHASCEGWNEDFLHCDTNAMRCRSPFLSFLFPSRHFDISL
jgi:hypothetical protein